MWLAPGITEMHVVYFLQLGRNLDLVYVGHESNYICLNKSARMHIKIHSSLGFRKRTFKAKRRRYRNNYPSYVSLLALTRFPSNFHRQTPL